MRVRIQTKACKYDFDIRAKDARLNISVKTQGKRGQTTVECWGQARQILLNALNRARVDEMKASRAE